MWQVDGTVPRFGPMMQSLQEELVRCRLVSTMAMANLQHAKTGIVRQRNNSRGEQPLTGQATRLLPMSLSASGPKLRDVLGNQSGILPKQSFLLPDGRSQFGADERPKNKNAEKLEVESWPSVNKFREWKMQISEVKSQEFQANRLKRCLGQTKSRMQSIWNTCLIPIQ